MKSKLSESIWLYCLLKACLCIHSSSLSRDALVHLAGIPLIQESLSKPQPESIWALYCPICYQHLDYYLQEYRMLKSIQSVTLKQLQKLCWAWSVRIRCFWSCTQILHSWWSKWLRMSRTRRKLWTSKCSRTISTVVSAFWPHVKWHWLAYRDMWISPQRVKCNRTEVDSKRTDSKCMIRSL